MFLKMGDISRSANKVLRVVDNLKSETGRLIDTFESLLQVMKRYQLKHNAANATAATTGLIGGVLCFTPLFPLGAGMVGAATGIAVVTDIVDSVEYREFKEKLEKELSSYNRYYANIISVDISMIYCKLRDKLVFKHMSSYLRNILLVLRHFLRDVKTMFLMKK